jgi:hypothetical protein
MNATFSFLARLAAPGFFILALAACKADPAVATVNGHAITMSELSRQVRVFQSVRPEAPDNESTRRQVLDQLVKQRLLVQMAREQGLDKDPARIQSIDARRAELRRELETGIANSQAQLKGLDEAVESKLLIEALSAAKEGGLSITAKDLKDAYQVRAALGALPPLEQVKDQLRKQVVLDRLVEEARAKAQVTLNLEALR